MLLSVMVCLHRHQFAQRHEWRGGTGDRRFGQGIGVAGTHAQREQFFRVAPAGERQLQDDIHVLFLARDVQQIHRLAAHGDFQRLRNRLRADAVQRRLFLVYHEFDLRLVGLDIPVRVHDAGRVVENINDLLRQLQTVLLGRPVNFSDQGLQHRRAGRHFGHGNPCAKFRGDFRHARTHPLGDVVALRLAFVFRHEVDLQIRHVRATPHEVVAHEAVEIERRRDAGVNFVIRHLWFGADGGGDFPRGLRGAFQRTAFRHVQDDLKFALVVERQHFHLHPADINQRHGDEQQHDERRRER